MKNTHHYMSKQIQNTSHAHLKSHGESFLLGLTEHAVILTQKSNDGEATPSSLSGHACQRILLAAVQQRNKLQTVAKVEMGRGRENCMIICFQTKVSG